MRRPHVPMIDNNDIAFTRYFDTLTASTTLQSFWKRNEHEYDSIRRIARHAPCESIISQVNSPSSSREKSIA